MSDLSPPEDQRHRKWRFANARPDPDFKYRSNALALSNVWNSIETRMVQGRSRAVELF